MRFSYSEQRIQRMSKEEFGALVRNETIDELCDWLHGCVESIDHNSEAYKACMAMVNAMRGKKTSETAALGNRVDTSSGETVSVTSGVVAHYPLTSKPTI